MSASGEQSPAGQRRSRAMLLPLFVVLGYWVLYVALREAAPARAAALDRVLPHHFDFVVLGALLLGLGRRLLSRWRALRAGQ